MSFRNTYLHEMQSLDQVNVYASVDGVAIQPKDDFLLARLDLEYTNADRMACQEEKFDLGVPSSVRAGI